ncbi:MAG TPA: response regulator, partial [Vicinamibacteria bacterium]|nr:response regulator [Vicinamibacteria bacterium]
PPDVLVTELKLRDVSGLTLVSRIRKLPGAANIGLVACTADGSVANRDAALKSGIEYYVAKADTARLVHVVAHAAGRG